MKTSLTALIVGAALSIGCSTSSTSQPKTTVAAAANPAVAQYQAVVAKIRGEGKQIEGRCEPLYVLPMGSCDGFQKCEAIARDMDNSFIIRAQDGRGYRLSRIALVSGRPLVVASYAADGKISKEIREWIIPKHDQASDSCDSFEALHAYASDAKISRKPTPEEEKFARRWMEDYLDNSWSVPAQEPAAVVTKQSKHKSAPMYTDKNEEVLVVPMENAEPRKGKQLKKELAVPMVKASAQASAAEAPDYFSVARAYGEPYKFDGMKGKRLVDSCPGYSNCSIAVMDNGSTIMKMSEWGHVKLYVGDKSGVTTVYEGDAIMHPKGFIRAKTEFGFFSSHNRGPTEELRRDITDADRTEYDALLKYAAKEAIANKRK